MLEPFFWRLKDAKTGEPVTLPHDRADFRGEPWTVYGGCPPTKLGSTGRVHVKDENDREREFYPSVYGLAWEIRPELMTAAVLMARDGSFTKHIGLAYLAADTSNAWRLLEAFPELFERYLEEVERAAEQY